MSERFCKRCKSTNVVEDGVYGGTTFYRCNTCHHLEDKEDFPEQTLFDQLTATPEVLAPCFVEKHTDQWDDDDYSYYSYLTKEWYATEDKAIAATVAKLKEVCDE